MEKAASQTAYELGAAMALIKFASQEVHPQVGELLVNTLSPAHRELLNTYQAVCNNMKQ